MSGRVLHPTNDRPLGRFVDAPITWLPWLSDDDLSQDVDYEATFGRRAKSPAFVLSARDVSVGQAMAAIEDSIFAKAEGGLERGYRELGALTASRVNGCPFCVSHHSSSTAKLLGNPDAVESILIDGVDSKQSPEWRVMIDAAVALTKAPIAFGPSNVDALRGIGFDDGMILDLIHSVAYFNSANRLLLNLGETTLA